MSLQQLEEDLFPELIWVVVILPLTIGSRRQGSDPTPPRSVSRCHFLPVIYSSRIG